MPAVTALTRLGLSARQAYFWLKHGHHPRYQGHDAHGNVKPPPEGEPAAKYRLLVDALTIAEAEAHATLAQTLHAAATANGYLALKVLEARSPDEWGGRPPVHVETSGNQAVYTISYDDYKRIQKEREHGAIPETVETESSPES